MYRLLEVTYTNDKETAAIYDNFADETALTAEFDTKMGQAIRAEAYKAELLVAFDETGRVYAQGFDSKDDTITLSPRLVWVSNDNDGETANQKKCNDMNDLKAEFYIKRGSAKKNADTKAFALVGVNGQKVVITDYWARPVEEVEPQEEVEGE